MQVNKNMENPESTETFLPFPLNERHHCYEHLTLHLDISNAINSEYSPMTTKQLN